jgi:hypothetical protein
MGRLSASWVWMLLAAGFLLSPLGDFLSVRGATALGGEARYSLYIRGTIAVGLAAALLLRGRLRAPSLHLALLATVPILAAGVTCAAGGMTVRELAEQAVFVFKVFSFFLYLAAISGLSQKRLLALEPWLRLALLVYAGAILAGASLSIEMFRSYLADTQIRSGYKGIVYAQNEASALMMVALAYACQRVLRLGWSFRDAVLVASLVGASLLIGTKAAAAAAVLVPSLYFYARHGAVQATLRAGVTLALLAAAAAAAYMLVPAVTQAADLTLHYFLYHYENGGSDKLATVVLSGRNLKFAKVWADLAQHNYLALLTGGYPVVRYLVEIDGPDLALAFGLPVFALYLHALARAFAGARSTPRISTPASRFNTLFFGVLLLAACTAGHVLVSAIIGPYLAFLAVMGTQSGGQPDNTGRTTEIG